VECIFTIQTNEKQEPAETLPAIQIFSTNLFLIFMLVEIMNYSMFKMLVLLLYWFDRNEIMLCLYAFGAALVSC